MSTQNPNPNTQTDEALAPDTTKDLEPGKTAAAIVGGAADPNNNVGIGDPNNKVGTVGIIGISRH